MMGNLKRVIIALPLLLTMVGCAGVDYVDNKTLGQMGLLDSKNSGVPKQFGAIMLTNEDSEDAEGKENKANMVFLKRYKSAYMAQTMLFDNTGDEKASFEKSYLTVGADRKKKSVRLELKFTF